MSERVTSYRGYALKQTPCGRTGVYLHGEPVHLAECESAALHWIDLEVQMLEHATRH